MNEEYDVAPRRKGGVGQFIAYARHSFAAGFKDTIAVIVREFELFLGTTLLIVGLLGFDSDKFCDGNTADYLSCTRPSTYYYFDALDIALVVIGVTLVLTWYLKQRRS